MTFDGEVSDCATPPVVKDHFLISLKVLPARSVAPVEIVATYLVRVVRLAEGPKVAVLWSELCDTAPPSFVVVSAILKVNVLVEIEESNIGSLNVTLIAELTGMLLVPPPGLVLITLGFVVSDCATPPVVKDHFLISLKVLPARSVAPVEIVATYLVRVARLAEGPKVAVLWSELCDTAPPSFVVVSAILKVNVLVEIEESNIGSLNVTLITELTGMLLVPPPGLVLVTVGRVVSADVELPR